MKLLTLATCTIAIAMATPVVAFAAQEPKAGKLDRPTTAPEPAPLAQIHYSNRVRSFEEQNRAFQHVVLLGDSITEGFNLDKFFPGRRIINRGIGSDVIGNNLPANDKRGVLKRLDSSVFDCSPTAVFILIGINDLGQGHSPEIVEQGYREMLTRIREKRPDLKLFIQSVLPCRDKFDKLNAGVEDVNKRLQKLAAEFDAKYLDLHSLMIDGKGVLKKEFTGDGLHLTVAGYEVWTEVIEEQLGWD